MIGARVEARRPARRLLHYPSERFMVTWPRVVTVVTAEVVRLDIF